MEQFKDRLIATREGSKLSQSDLARLCGMAPTQLARYENGKATPRRSVMRRLADALNVPPDWLEHGDYPYEPDLSPVHTDDPLDVKVRKHPDGGTELIIGMDDETSELFRDAALRRNMSLNDYLKEVLIAKAHERAKQERTAKTDPVDIEAVARKVKELLIEDGVTIKKN